VIKQTAADITIGEHLQARWRRLKSGSRRHGEGSAKWDGAKLVITTDHDAGSQVQTRASPALMGRK
jgi:hypothetical protein